jgi:hypothetical protein
MDWLQDWQELVGALLGAASSLLLAGVAIFREEIRERMSRKRLSVVRSARLRVFCDYLLDYTGGLQEAREQVVRYKERGSNIAFAPIRVPFAPSTDKFVGEDAYFLGPEVEVALAQYQISNLELERVLEKNHSSLVLRLHPGGGERAEAEIPKGLPVPHELLARRLDDALDSSDTLRNSLNSRLQEGADAVQRASATRRS